jgi:glycosyltransferase involved in cell wall biosynthesis
LFIGSAHPPNISGFFETLGDSLGFLPPDRKICVVGSVASHITEHPHFQRWLPINLSRVISLGLLEDADLAAVKTLAHVFILPITEGGGSNIKTAEALYSGKYVIGTHVSFRGFEEYLCLPGVHRTDTPAQFRETLHRILQAPPLVSGDEWQTLRERLVWHHTLAPMTRAVGDFLATSKHQEFGT